MTTYDRYLLGRYYYFCGVILAAAMGLYVVMDGFTNLDDFQHTAGDDGVWSLLCTMGQHYLYRSCWVFDVIGPTVCVLAALCTLALTLRNGEVNPVLAAGVPIYRLAMPLMYGLLSINALMAVNQEWIIPRISPHLVGSRGNTADDAQRVEPMYDLASGIFVSGDKLFLADRMIRDAEFRLAPPLVSEHTSLKADAAVYFPKGNAPAGWLLTNVRPTFADLRLEAAGQRIIVPQPNPDAIFVVSDLTFDQLYSSSTSYRFLPTRELLDRISKPSTSPSTMRAQRLYLHGRLTRPVLALIGLFLVIPLIAHRERTSLITNIAICMATLGSVYGLAQGMLLLGHTGWIGLELCAWGPLIFGGGLCAWLSPLART